MAEEKFIELCDDRFEIIARAREHIIEATNIESRPEEMQVLDNFLFRCWQMGWLKNDYKALEKEIAELKEQNESLKDTLQAIATDTNEHITHNVAQNELDKWEKSK